MNKNTTSELLQKAYENYTQTKVTFTKEGVIHSSPRGHYTHETIDEFEKLLLTDDSFNEQWSDGCTVALTHRERTEIWDRMRLEKANKEGKILSPGVYTTEPGPSFAFLDKKGIPKRKIIEDSFETKVKDILKNSLSISISSETNDFMSTDGSTRTRFEVLLLLDGKEISRDSYYN